MKEIDKQIIEQCIDQEVSITELSQELSVSTQTIRNRVSNLSRNGVAISVENSLIVYRDKRNYIDLASDESAIRFAYIIGYKEINTLANKLYMSNKTVYAKLKKEQLMFTENFKNFLQVHVFIENNYQAVKDIFGMDRVKCHQSAKANRFFNYSNLKVEPEEAVLKLANSAIFGLQNECDQFVERFIEYAKYAFDSVNLQPTTISNLKIHLRNSFIKYYFDIVEEEYIDKAVIQKYDGLFNYFKENIDLFLETENLKLSRNEYIYIYVILIKDLNSYSRPITNIAILCEKGVATSFIIEHQIKENFTDFRYIYIGTKQNQVIVNDLLETSCLVINLGTKLNASNVLNVSGALKSTDIERLRTEFNLVPSKQLNNYKVYLKVKSLLKSNVSFEMFNNELSVKDERGEYMLIDLINKEMIQVVQIIDSWEEAVSKCAQPLLDLNYIEQPYVDAMIKNIIELGTYIVLTDGFALPHSKPEDGALKVGVSMLVVEEGVMFPDNKLVHIIMTLSTSKANEHLQALVDISELLKKEKFVTDIKKLVNPEDIYEYIKNI